MYSLLAAPQTSEFIVRELRLNQKSQANTGLIYPFSISTFALGEKSTLLYIEERKHPVIWQQRQSDF